jgi:hypothetical protein
MSETPSMGEGFIEAYRAIVGGHGGAPRVDLDPLSAEAVAAALVGILERRSAGKAYRRAARSRRIAVSLGPLPAWRSTWRSLDAK